MNEQELVIFAHLQRTGGTSLRDLLGANYGASATARGSRDAIGTYIQRAQAGRLRAVEGLFRHGAHRYLCPGGAFRYFTFVRAPLARWISYYNFCLIHPNAGLRTLAMENKLEQFLAHPKRPRNAAAQLVCGYELAPSMAALQAQLPEFSFVGVQERFVESVFVLARVFGMPFPFPGVVGRLADKAPARAAPPSTVSLGEDDALDEELQRIAAATLDRVVNSLGGADREALAALKSVTEAAAGAPELATLLDAVRGEGTPGARSVQSLRARLRELPAAQRAWGAQVAQVLDHFAATAPAPELWRAQLSAPGDAAAAAAAPAATFPRSPAPAPTPTAPKTPKAPETRKASPTAPAAAAPIGLRGKPVSLDGLGPFTLQVESVPALPERALFLEHHSRGLAGGSEVVAVAGKRLQVSRDLGRTWRSIPLGGIPGMPVRCFTTAEGRRLLQVKDDSRIHVYDADGRAVGVAGADRGALHWHGSWSIDQSAAGTLCWAEYVGRAERVAAHRSTDGGASWQPVLELDGRAGEPGSIRHFHTVLADPHVPGRWYLSSGDRAGECRFWVSTDDARTWTDIGEPQLADPRAYPDGPNPRQLYRTTCAVIGQEWIHWSTDDIIGGKGPLFVRMRKQAPYTIEILGRVGTQPSRALVRHRDDLFVALSQGDAGSDHVAVHLLAADGRVAEVLRLPKPVDALTSFCRSVASRSTDAGVFFCAGGGDVLDPRPRMWRWEIRS